MTVVDDNQSRVQTAYDYLVAEITAFRIRTGAQLSENRLAAQLGISRTPVREALQRLEKEGLVRRTENARFAVSQPTIQEAADACDILEILDAYIARRAAERISTEDADTMVECVARMAAATEEGDRDAWSAADLDFHRLVNRLSDNELAAELVKETRRRVQRFWMRAPAVRARLDEGTQEHRALVTALIAQDYAAIDAAVSTHSAHIREHILELLAPAAMLFGE